MLTVVRLYIYIGETRGEESLGGLCMLSEPWLLSASVISNYRRTATIWCLHGKEGCLKQRSIGRRWPNGAYAFFSFSFVFLFKAAFNVRRSRGCGCRSRSEGFGCTKTNEKQRVLIARVNVVSIWLITSLHGLWDIFWKRENYKKTA